MIFFKRFSVWVPLRLIEAFAGSVLFAWVPIPPRLEFQAVTVSHVVQTFPAVLFYFYLVSGYIISCIYFGLVRPFSSSFQQALIMSIMFLVHFWILSMFVGVLVLLIPTLLALPVVWALNFSAAKILQKWQ